MNEPVFVRVNPEKPLTLAELVPGSWETPLRDMVITRIYAGGTRLDEGWKHRWDGINRLIPPMIPHKNKGRNLQNMTVMVNPGDRMTVETIFAYYTGGYCVEYGMAAMPQ